MSVRSSRLRSTARAALLSALILPVATPVLAQSAGQDPEPEARTTQLDDIIVTGAPFGISAEASLIAVDVLDQEALSTAPSGTLGDVLSGLPGVRSTAFSPGASRPVIRGLAGPRVQVLTNGMGLIDASSLSPDHQVAADPGEAVRIEVLRGPQTLAYGGSAIGGVVNVIDGRIPEEAPYDGFDGRVTAQASSVDNGRSIGAGVTLGQGPWVLTLDGLDRRSDDYDIPVPAESRRQVEDEGEVYEDTGSTTVENSASRVRAFGSGLSYIGEQGFIGVSVKRTESDYGVPGHAHEDHGGGATPPDEEEDVTIGLEQTRYDLRGEWRFVDAPIDRIRLSAGYADYTHTEFEGDEIGTVFTSEGLEGRLELVMPRRGGWNAAYGLQGLSRDFDAAGDEAYVPPVEITELGVYTLHRYDMDSWGLEGGLRFDTRDLDSPIGGQRDFSNVSASAGVYFKPVEALFLGLSLSRNGRAPTEAELFAEGPHIATRAFEVGNADLDSEKVTSIEATVHWEQGPWTADMHLFRADYDGFIDLRPTGAEADELPVFAYVQTDAEFHGMEARLDYQAWQSGEDGLTLGLGYDYVRGETDLGAPARIPPWSLNGKAELDLGPWTTRLTVRRVGEQDRVTDFELPTDAYTTADLYLGWSPDREQGLTLYVEGRNLGDAEVREHTSFLKDLTPLPGRNLRAGMAWRF
ncbi:MAG: TonB-dependent receptor [Brevundimonas sp.]|uniref:TonB-dependent receptor n=1 Tax=Brevundimonas sp. TaxID=1871086 RepID=UPI0030020B1F